MPQDLPIQMVCSTKFGRYPKISAEQTFNMYQSNDFMVPYAGHKVAMHIKQNGSGRDGYNCVRGGFLLVVINEEVYILTEGLHPIFIGALGTSSGDIFIAENDANQIGICDKLNIYIYDYSASTFSKVTTDFIPDSLCFQDGYFIAAVKGMPEWRLSAINNGLSWPANPENIGVLQAPDNVVCCIPSPNVQGQLYVFGSTVVHCFNDTGNSLFPYERNNSFAIDYGCISSATIASGDMFVIWLGSNAKAGLSIMYSTGGVQQQISDNGINYKLSTVQHPEMSYGSLVKIDGNLFYQLSFVHPADNWTLAYNFNTKTFTYLTDAFQNHHEAKRIFYFNKKYYFVSYDDGNLYEMSTNYVTYSGKEIPRIIIPPTIRAQKPSIFKKLEFVIEQGDIESQDAYSEILQFKGTISQASDFPTLASVKMGDEYEILDSVIDNDPTKTNTNQNFGKGYIVWNGTKWDIVFDLFSRVDLSLSYDGGYSWGSNVSRQLNAVGHRKNILNWHNLGLANELTCQFRFYGFSKFVLTNGTVTIL